MGYRSDVRIITSKKGFDELKKITDKILKDKNIKYGNLMDDCKIIYDNGYSKYFGWDSIKWYDGIEGYEDVDAIIEGLKKLEEQDYSYRFARLGESYDDYEESYYESEKEEEQNLEYPSLLRQFDDDYTVDNMKYYEDKEITISSEKLGNGWEWHKYNDESGHLQSPDGKEYMLYDLQTNEYKVKNDSDYEFFPLNYYYADGVDPKNFKAFEYMENEIMRLGLNKEQDLEV